MAESLLIVESPTKVKTINKFLGEKFHVMACMGHVRGLPSRSGSVDIANDFTPRYEVIAHSTKNLGLIKKALSGVKEIYLATDLDREGEAIAWHLVEALGLDKGEKKKKIALKRITFHEITETAITEALKHPRHVSMPLVDAQQGRAVLDYLFGFNLSPFLWRKVRSGLSAGRVQSPALSMICERELEIRAFKEEEYWTITAQFSTEKPASSDTTFNALLTAVNDRPLEKLGIKNETHAKEIITALREAHFQIKKIQKQERKDNPSPPLITSTLQQEASTKLGFSAKKTMTLAQRLYEGVEIGGESEGLITYMRTDSFNLAAGAIESIRDFIPQQFGTDYLNKTIRRFKQKSKTAQEAHEAIRPTDIIRTPESLKPYLSPDQHKLYDLIWRRTIATQMSQSIEDRVSVDIQGGESYLFRAHGSILTFPGFKKVFLSEQETKSRQETDALPPLTKNQALELVALNPDQHFTKPPPRYTEASLVKALEEYGIGRPSTYASIISVLQDRDYVKLESRKFIPQEIGMIVHKLLKDHFSRYVDYQFTAQVENELDSIARGEASWKAVVKNFWEPFSQLIKKKSAEVKKSDVVNEPTAEICPECGKPLVIRLGPYSRFLACTGYPKCRFVNPISSEEISPETEEKKTDEVCEKCGLPMSVKRSRYGLFLGCSGYPTCTNTKPLGGGTRENQKTSEEKCEKCGEFLVIKKNRFGRTFLACPNYPKCTYAKSIKKKPAVPQKEETKP